MEKIKIKSKEKNAIIESLKADGYVFKSLDYLDNSNETEAEAQAKFNYAPQKILAQQYTTINQ